MELELQAERKVPMWTSMYELIITSNAASLYVQTFLDRKKSKDFVRDMDDGEIKEKAEQSGGRDLKKTQSLVRSEVHNFGIKTDGLAKRAAANSESPTRSSSRLPANYNHEVKTFKFLTPLDFVKDRSLKSTADNVQELVSSTNY